MIMGSAWSGARVLSPSGYICVCVIMSEINKDIVGKEKKKKKHTDDND